MGNDTQIIQGIPCKGFHLSAMFVEEATSDSRHCVSLVVCCLRKTGLCHCRSKVGSAHRIGQGSSIPFVEEFSMYTPTFDAIPRRISRRREKFPCMLSPRLQVWRRADVSRRVGNRGRWSRRPYSRYRGVVTIERRGRPRTHVKLSRIFPLFRVFPRQRKSVSILSTKPSLRRRAKGSIECS